MLKSKTARSKAKIMPMELGISTYLFEWLSLEKQVPLLNEVGIRLIEIWGFPHHFNYYDERCRASLKESLKRCSIKVNSIHSPWINPYGRIIDIGSSDKRDRWSAILQVKKMINLLSFLEGEILVLHPVKKANDSLNILSEFAEEKGIKIAIETNLNGIGSKIEELIKIVDDVNIQNLGICLDTSHVNINNNLIEAVKLCEDRLITLHVSDNFGKTDDHLLPFQGSINWSEFIQALKIINYAGPFMMEIRGLKKEKFDANKKYNNVYDFGRKTVYLTSDRDSLKNVLINAKKAYNRLIK